MHFKDDVILLSSPRPLRLDLVFLIFGLKSFVAVLIAPLCNSLSDVFCWESGRQYKYLVAF